MASTRNIIEILINAIDKSAPGLAKAEKNLKTYGQTAQNVGKRVLAAGAIATGGIGLIVREQAKLGDEYEKTFRRTGIAVEELSSLSFAAEQSGADLAALRLGLRRVAQSAFDASQGLAEPARNFADLGIAVTDANGRLRPTLDLVLEASDKFKDLDDATRASALAQKIFGRSGDLLLPLLKEGKEGIKALTDESRELGRVWSLEDAKAAADLVDAQNRVNSALKGVRKEIFLALAPALTSLADKTSEAIKPVIAFVKENKGLVQAFGAASVLLLGGGGLIFALGQLAISFGALLPVLGSATTAMRAFVAARTVAQLGALGLGVGALTAVFIGLNEQTKRQAEQARQLREEQAKNIAASHTEAQVLERLVILRAALADLQKEDRASSLKNNLQSILALATQGRFGFTGPEANDEIKKTRSELETVERALALIREREEDAAQTAEILAQQLDNLMNVDVDESAVSEGLQQIERDIAGFKDRELRKTVTTDIEPAIPEIQPQLNLEDEDGLDRFGQQLLDLGIQGPENIDKIAVALGKVSDFGLAVGQQFLNLGTAAQGFANLAVGAVNSIGAGFGNLVSQGILGAKLQLKDFGKVFVQVFAQVVGAIVAAIVKMLAFRLLFSFIPGLGTLLGGQLNVGSLLGGQQGGLVRAQSGGFVTGGIPGRDSVPVLTQPGELIVPKEGVAELLRGSLRSVNVNVNVGLMNGDQGSALELARVVEQRIRQVETGAAY